MNRSYVVTGGGRGVGRAIVQRLLDDGHAVVTIEFDPAALAWTGAHPATARLVPVVGDASDETVTGRAADEAEALGRLAGWVNNAAVFRDAAAHTAPVVEINVSSHQAQRAVPGCLPYVTAKAAIEGLTRALAVEYGARGVRRLGKRGAGRGRRRIPVGVRLQPGHQAAGRRNVGHLAATRPRIPNGHSGAER